MSTMDNKSNYQDDLEGIKGMPLHPKDTPFIVPSNYFDDLESKILQRIEVIVDTEKSFSVPSNYFDTLAQRIMDRVDAEKEMPIIGTLEDDRSNPFLKKLKEIAPTAGYAVPDKYFENLTVSVQQSLDSTLQKGKEELQKVIPFRKKKSKFTSWISYLAAACIVISLGTYTFLQLQTSTVNSFEQKLSVISDGEIVGYLEYYSEPGDDTIFEVQFEGVQQTDKSNFSEEDIEAYLDYSI